MEKLLLSVCLLLVIFGPKELTCAVVRSDATRSILSPTFIFKRLSTDLDSMAKRTVTADDEKDDDEGTDKRDRDMDAFLYRIGDPWAKSQRSAQAPGKGIQFNLTKERFQIAIKLLKPPGIKRNFLNNKFAVLSYRYFLQKLTIDKLGGVQKDVPLFLGKRDDSYWIDDDDITSQRSSFSTLESILRRGLRDTGVGSRERSLATEKKNTIRQSPNSLVIRSFGSRRRRRDRRRRRYKGKSHKKSHHHSFDFDSTEEEREPILDIFGKGTGNKFKRETPIDSYSTSTSESTESVESTSSDDNQATNTTAAERGFFGKSKKKGGPKHHPLKRAFSRMWRRAESTEPNSTLNSESTESVESTSSDDNQATNTTTVERGFFGKSKKKGGPKQHPLKRASFSRMWRRGESTESKNSWQPQLQSLLNQ